MLKKKPTAKNKTNLKKQQQKNKKQNNPRIYDMLWRHIQSNWPLFKMVTPEDSSHSPFRFGGKVFKEYKL